jgi:hypothetical protein
LPDEPAETLAELVEQHGAGVVLKALARVLYKARRKLRTEGELEAARALRLAATTCEAAGDALTGKEL